ncbi:MAG: hypothetical protein WC002_04190 [Candidatus Muiribacteriota bacterium]|jgi:hypothetical protein
MSPINPVDINTHLAADFNVSKIKEAQDNHEHGQAQHPALLKQKEEEEKSKLHRIDETENSGIDPKAKRESEQEEKRKKEQQKQKENESINKMKALFGEVDKNRGSRIDIKL